MTPGGTAGGEAARRARERPACVAPGAEPDGSADIGPADGRHQAAGSAAAHRARDRARRDGTARRRVVPRPHPPLLRPLGDGDGERARDRGTGGGAGGAVQPTSVAGRERREPRRRGIEQLPWVRSATVHVAWPDGVHIAVVEETARFTASTPGGQWESLSADGRVLGESPTRPPGLLLLTVPQPPGAPGTVLADQGRAGTPGGVVAAGVVRGTGDAGDRRAGRLGAAGPDHAHRGRHRDGGRAHGQIRGRLLHTLGGHPAQWGCDRCQRPRCADGDAQGDRRMLDQPERHPYGGVTLPHCEHQPSPEVQGWVAGRMSSAASGGTIQRATGRRSTRGRGSS